MTRLQPLPDQIIYSNVCTDPITRDTPNAPKRLSINVFQDLRVSILQEKNAPNDLADTRDSSQQETCRSGEQHRSCKVPENSRDHHRRPPSRNSQLRSTRSRLTSFRASHIVRANISELALLRQKRTVAPNIADVRAESSEPGVVRDITVEEKPCQ